MTGDKMCYVRIGTCTYLLGEKKKSKRRPQNMILVPLGIRFKICLFDMGVPPPMVYTDINFNFNFICYSSPLYITYKKNISDIK